jgi:hypothetical protein
MVNALGAVAGVPARARAMVQPSPGMRADCRTPGLPTLPTESATHAIL